MWWYSRATRMRRASVHPLKTSRVTRYHSSKKFLDLDFELTVKAEYFDPYSGIAQFWIHQKTSPQPPATMSTHDADLDEVMRLSLEKLRTKLEYSNHKFLQDRIDEIEAKNLVGSNICWTFVST